MIVESTPTEVLDTDRPDILAVIFGALLAFITFLLVIAIPLYVNHFWSGFIEVPVFMAGFGFAGKLVGMKH